MDVNVQNYASDAISLGKEPPGTRWTASCVGLRAGLDGLENKNIFLLSGSETDTVQPVA